MTRTFLVALNLTDSSDLTGLALDLEEDLTSAGHDVESVRPWGSPLDQLTPTTPKLVLPPTLSSAEPTPTQQT